MFLCVLICITSRYAAAPCYEGPGNIGDPIITITCQEVKKIGQDRLIVAGQCDKSDVSIYEPVRKNNAPTSATLYQVVKHTKDRDQKTVMTADRNVLRRLITSYEAGRSVDLSSGLKHELLPVRVYIIGFENCQSFFSYNCPCTYGVPQCTSLIVTTLAKLSKQLRNITYRQLFNKHHIVMLVSKNGCLLQ